MKERMTGFVSGVIILYCGIGIPVLKQQYFNLSLFFALLLFFLIFLSLFKLNGNAASRCCLFLIFVSIGALYFLNHWGYLQKTFKPNAVSNAALFGRNLILDGYPCSLPRLSQYGSTLEFCTLRARGEDSEKFESILAGKKFKLSARFYPYDSYFDEHEGKLHTIVVRLSKIHTTKNPIGFDESLYLFRKNIYAKGRIISWYGKKAGELSCSLSCHYHAWRGHLLRNMQERFEKFENKGLMLALSMGYRGSLSLTDKALLNATGTQHLIAISGLHIGLVAGLVWLVCHWMLAYFLIFQRSHAFICLSMSLVAAFIYTAMAGFPVSAQRALIMLMCFYFFAFIKRKPGFSSPLLISACIILLVDPFAVMDAGFWLSYIAVILIIFTSAYRLGWAEITEERSLSLILKVKQGFHSLIRIQWVILLGLSVLLIGLGMQVALISFPANLVAVPLVSSLVIPLLVIGHFTAIFSDPVSSLFFGFADTLLSFNLTFLSFLKSMPLDSSYFQWRSLLLALPVLSLAVLVVPSFAKFKIYIIALLIVFFIKGDAGSFQSGLNITVLDIKKSFLVVVSQKESAIVYANATVFKFYRLNRLLIPFLKQQNIKRIDALIIGAGKIRNEGLFSEFLDRFKIPRVYLSKFIMPVNDDHEFNSEFKPCSKEDEWKWTAYKFKILSQRKAGSTSGNQKVSSANHACVMALKGLNAENKLSLLISGRLEKSGINRLIKNQKIGSESIDIWVSNLARAKLNAASSLISWLKPDSLIISAKLSPAEYETWQEKPIIVHNTYIDGAVSLYPALKEGKSAYKTQKKQGYSMY